MLPEIDNLTYDISSLQAKQQSEPLRLMKKSGFNNIYFEKLSLIEPNNYWFTSRRKLLLSSLLRFFPGTRTFLEIGCGTGYILEGIEKAFPHIQLYGSDIYPEGLAVAKRRVHKAHLFEMDATHIPFTDEYDVIGAFDVLEHIDDDCKVLQQMYKATRVNGGIILTVPQHDILWSSFDDLACHVRRYTAKDLRAKVEKAGFKICRMTSFVTLLMPLMLLSRIRMRGSNDIDPFHELSVGRMTNSLFEAVLAAERAFLRMDLNLPFGGSLLLVARKEA